MKNFLRRLKFYGLGFGIGMIFVFFFFQNRGCTWLPSNRVKNTILGRVIVVNDSQMAQLKKHGVNRKDLIGFLNDGEVAFDDSKKQGNPQVYSIKRDVNGKEVKLWFTLPKDAFISEVQWPSGSVFRAHNSVEGYGSMVHFPNIKNIVYLDTNRHLTCQQSFLGLISPMDVMKCLKRNGRVDFSKADLNADPYPLQFVTFTTRKGKLVSAETYWYQEHIRFREFILQDTLDCGGY